MREPYPVSPWCVVCSKCQGQGPSSDNVRSAVALAEGDGWRAGEIRGQRVTLCPACVETVREWHAAPAIEWGPEVQP